MTFDKDFDFNGFDKGLIEKIAENCHEIFRTDFFCGDVLICKADKADVAEYEEMTINKAIDEILDIVASYSKDGSVESAMEELSKLSSDGNGAEYAGWLFASRVTELRRQGYPEENGFADLINGLEMELSSDDTQN